MSQSSTYESRPQTFSIQRMSLTHHLCFGCRRARLMADQKVLHCCVPLVQDLSPTGQEEFWQLFSYPGYGTYCCGCHSIAIARRLLIQALVAWCSSIHVGCGEMHGLVVPVPRYQHRSSLTDQHLCAQSSCESETLFRGGGLCCHP